MPNLTRLKDCVVTNKNVIVRVDINVPIVDGVIEDDSRIKAVIPTLEYLAKQNAKVIVISHFGRPKIGAADNSAHSLKQLVGRISELLGEVKVGFVDDCIGEKVEQAVKNTNYGEIILLENLRFYEEETNNDATFAAKLASLGNLFVNDAFSCCHRAHASIVGINKILKSCAGFLLEKELDSLGNLLDNSAKPMIAIIGGAKISTKLDLINNLSKKVDAILVGGGMANSFFYALGNNIGKSLCEKDLKDTVLKIIEVAKQNNCKIILPTDVVVTRKLQQNASCFIVGSDKVEEDDIIVDIGPASVAELTTQLQNYKTLVWNGPLGAFEFKPFNIGTESLARSVASLTRQGKLSSVAGGGDVVSALNSSGLIDEFSYISTAGGAFLEWLEGKKLPGVAALEVIFD